MIYPDEGELFFAQPDKNTPTVNKPLIFFVHFLGGHKKVLKRHIDLVNSLGFDAYVFNLKDSWKDHAYLPYSHRSRKFGLKHAMADQIEEHLNQFEQYPQKIIFSFSNISGSAFEAVAHRIKQHHANDVLAAICDSGPGLEFITSAYHLVKYQFKTKSLALRLIQTPIVALGWSPHLNKDIADDLKLMPQGFPILSIRGWKDLLISPNSIDSIFEPHPNLNWKKLNLPEAGHINGLKDFADDYIPPVARFLKEVSVLPSK